MLGQTCGKVLIQLFPLDFELLMIPSQLLQIQIQKILQAIPFGIHSSQNQHVLAHQGSPVVSSAFNGLLVAHFQGSAGPRLQIYQIYTIVANSAFSTDIVDPHSSKNDHKSTLVKDRRMIASGCRNLKLLYPQLFVERIDLSREVGVAAMSSNNDCHILIDSGGMSFSRLGLPSIQSKHSIDHSILSIFGQCLHYTFLNHFSDFSIQRRQSLLFVIVYVQNFLIAQGFLDVLIQLVIPQSIHLGFYSRESLFVIVEEGLQGRMIVLSEGGINSSVSIEVFLFVGLAGEIDLMEIVEAIMDGLEEALLCEGVIGLMVRL